MQLITEILTRIRRSGTRGEESFVAWLVSYLEGLGCRVDTDGYGNLWTVVGDGQAATLFTCHTDTVHSTRIPDTVQRIRVSDGIIRLAEPEPGYVLGADDGAGIWMLVRMIERGVTGRYVFYRDEEVGGLGSEWSVKNEPWRYVGIRHAVAFDRMDIGSVITHQGFARCCSDKFAQALADGLNASGFAFESDDGGTFTDTANLTALVPECTNLSVGYYNQHTMHECLDFNFLQNLLDAVCKLDWQSLPCVREPGEPGEDDPYYGEADEESVFMAVAQEIEDSGFDYAEELVWSDPDLAARLLVWLCRS